MTRKLVRMDLIPSPGFAIRNKSRWPNTIVFPKELRDAIPDYGSRALVFDSVGGSHSNAPVSISGMIGETQFDFGARTQIRLLVHETGKLDGQFTLLVDLDSETTRELGKFLIEVADQAEAKKA
jgi:hypothetical protein